MEHRTQQRKIWSLCTRPRFILWTLTLWFNFAANHVFASFDTEHCVAKGFSLRPGERLRLYCCLVGFAPVSEFNVKLPGPGPKLLFSKQSISSFDLVQITLAPFSCLFQRYYSVEDSKFRKCRCWIWHCAWRIPVHGFLSPQTVQECLLSSMILKSLYVSWCTSRDLFLNPLLGAAWNNNWA